MRCRFTQKRQSQIINLVHQRVRAAYKNGIDGVEVWYDYEHNQKWRPTPLICNSIEDLADKYKLLKTCGTDSHGYSLLAR